MLRYVCRWGRCRAAQLNRSVELLFVCSIGSVCQPYNVSDYEGSTWSHERVVKINANFYIYLNFFILFSSNFTSVYFNMFCTDEVNGFFRFFFIPQKTSPAHIPCNAAHRATEGDFPLSVYKLMSFIGNFRSWKVTKDYHFLYHPKTEEKNGEKSFRICPFRPFSFLSPPINSIPFQRKNNENNSRLEEINLWFILFFNEIVIILLNRFWIFN